jgi:type I restriction enzyme, S subunit
MGMNSSGFDASTSSARALSHRDSRTLKDRNTSRSLSGVEGKGNIPELRFPGFDGEWGIQKLGILTSKIGSGSTPRGGEKVYLSEGVIFIRSQNVFNNNLDLAQPTYISQEVHRGMRGSTVMPRDVLLNITGASIGRSCVVSNSFTEGNVNQHVCIIRPLKSLQSEFLQLILSSSLGQKLIFQGQTGSGREGLNFQSIASFKLKLPSLPEQQKIANFLTTIDKKITQLTQKKEALTQYKKGMMQKLFPKAGETVPELRFPGFEGNWKEKSLGEVAKINPKNDELPTSFNYVDLESVNNGILKNTEVICKENAPSRAQRILKTGDILYQTVRPYQKNNLFFNIEEGEFVASTGYALLRTKNISMYLYQLLHTQGFVNKVILRCTGTSYPAINSSDLSKIKVLLPTLAEQQKIANLLTTFDDKITQIDKKINKMTQFKKGLLQQMFV